ncbi:MAG: RNA polymerase factor sigma-54 [Alphaproteobacteria bacterium]|nr:RNA polymerase factor sigma-54 [Alphaproteobacteria bacterium]
MALSPRLELRQGQSLVMTPQLQQAIKLLQLSNQELAEFIEAELERNPLLDREEVIIDAPLKDENAALLKEEGPPSEADAGLDLDAEALNPDLSAGDMAEAQGAVDWSKVGSGRSLEDLPDFEDSLTAEMSLQAHIESQLMKAAVSPAQRLIAAALLDDLDEAGYYRGRLEDTAARLGAPLTEVGSVLALLQGFEPAGVMARDVAECLALQLKDRNRFDPAMEALVANLELLARGQMERLMALCGVDREDLQYMVAEIRSLTPKPGASFGGAPAVTAVADVYVRAAADGAWLVELNTDCLPKVLVNQVYAATVSARVRSDQEKSYVSACAASASWLVKSLDQRAKTILKVSREIVRQQDGFLAHGVSHLRPLNLKTVANAIDMHESTVSRVTTNKFMATPRGLFELKYFFTAAIQASDGGDALSAEAVRHRIKALIDKETGADILSDDRIVEILREDGVDIARRTVAKYREGLRIPSSVERKRRMSRGL